MLSTNAIVRKIPTVNKMKTFPNTSVVRPSSDSATLSLFPSLSLVSEMSEKMSGLF